MPEFYIIPADYGYQRETLPAAVDQAKNLARLHGTRYVVLRAESFHHPANQFHQPGESPKPKEPPMARPTTKKKTTKQPATKKTAAKKTATKVKMATPKKIAAKKKA